MRTSEHDPAIRTLKCTLIFGLALSHFALLSAGISADVDKDTLAKLTAKLGHTFWSAPDKRLVRATTYKKGKDAVGSNSHFQDLTLEDQKALFAYAMEYVSKRE